MAEYSEFDRIQWIEPTNPPTDPVAPLLLNLIGIFVPIAGLGHIVLGQQKKGIFFLVLVLLAFAPIVLSFIPFVSFVFCFLSQRITNSSLFSWLDLLALPLNGILLIVRFCINIYLIIDVYYLADRLRRGIPITINESTFFAFPLLNKFTKNPSCVSDSPNNPSGYFERVAVPQQTVVTSSSPVVPVPVPQQAVVYQSSQATNYGATQAATTMYPGNHDTQV